MARLTGFLLMLVVASSLGVVASQHQARKLYTAVEREQQRSQQLEVEWGQLQLEQSTWAAHARIEKLAREKLAMRPPSVGADHRYRGAAMKKAKKGVTFNHNPLLRSELSAWRPRFVLLCLLGGSLALIGRAAYLQGVHDQFLQAKGESRYARVLEVPATRGKITDRQGDVLAVSSP
jgi:cell division protein FtsL